MENEERTTTRALKSGDDERDVEAGSEAAREDTTHASKTAGMNTEDCIVLYFEAFDQHQNLMACRKIESLSC
jgi:hypothetical protein